MGSPALVLAACLAVAAVSDRIAAGDLALASPAFAELDPGTVVGWAPAPGVRRIFALAELRRIAARLGAAAIPDAGLCVERIVAPLDAARILAAIEAQRPRGSVEVLDFSRTPAPEGELVFPRTGLRTASGSAYFWSGYVRYAGTRRFAVWAKVAVRTEVPVVVAAVDLKPGHPIGVAELREEARKEVFASGLVGSVDDAIGKWPRRPIRAGAVVAAQWLEPAPDVVRGETVKVEVSSGGAHLEMEARAEGEASIGERVVLRNPVSQKRFFGRVEGKGRVSAGPGGERP